ncbi:2-keto-4-pentenoate hydratase [Marinobacterium aestuariivivens]|uniref:2-keto-4-pentenoate hydratase n=1 Tax=Marinobacterium aestuariivivens TaxID=1698799 RepID=A0ABW2A2F7_9GAMM
MPLSESQVEQASALLLNAYRTGRQIEALPAELEPQSFEDCYAIQDRVAATQSNGRIRAWKTGAPNPQTTPYGAPIFEQVVLQSPASIPAEQLHMIGIEVELCYRLDRDLPARERAYSSDEVAGAIEEVQVVVEVVDTRLRQWQDCAELWKLADNQINGALVLGSGTSNWRDLDPAQLTGQLLVNGALQVEGTGCHSVGDPFTLVDWLANHLTGRNGGLQRGDLVTTGTWTGMVFVQPGDEVIGRFPGVGEARIRFPA